jgi:hypothetical protein
MTKAELLEAHPLLKVNNKLEFKQRLAWLSDGMLYNHLNGIINYTINEQEKRDYLQYKHYLNPTIKRKALCHNSQW